ncbi:hypothetical protein MESS2_280030 [Mesorhizobium metallidurans STM 2683]|uniref:Uncharacterized protein n=1 Tax=Mesorhizobium metallidurans STM 2683 TaxID=1297569 RepID=M5EPT7_9HYPH|nr:hypothetical protein MESS2_280030 [Mesorhizobium metallidurans STM 2683]
MSHFWFRRPACFNKARTVPVGMFLRGCGIVTLPDYTIKLNIVTEKRATSRPPFLF